MIGLDEVTELLEQYHPYGEYGMALCVWHEDSNPSMQVSERGYYCKSCHASGSLLKLYNKISGRPIQHKERVYNPSAWIWKNWEGQYGDIKSVCKYAHQNIISKPEMGSYLYKRGLTLCHIKQATLGYLGGYYIFPIRDDNGEVQGAVARASPTIQTKNNRYSVSDKKVKLYIPDIEMVKQAEELYVCYGTLDAWSLTIAGYAGLTGISGQELNAVNLEKYRKPIYIIADKKEHISAIQLQSKLGWRGKRLDINWPDGCKDLNDVHTKLGIDVMKELIEKEKERYNYD